MRVEPNGRRKPRPGASLRRGVAIIKLADGRHVARWRDPWTGAVEQQSLDYLGCKNAKQRQRWCEEFSDVLAEDRREAAKGRRRPRNRQLDDARAEYIGLRRAERTRLAAQTPLRLLVEHLRAEGVVNVADIRREDLVGFADKIRSPQNSYKESTKAHHLKVARLFLYHCLERNLVSPDLTERDIQRALRPDRAGKGFIEVLQRDAQQELLRAAIAHDDAGHEPVAPFVLAVLASGMRLGEAEGLLFEEFDRDEPAIRLPSNRVKTRNARVITLSETPTLARLLDALAARASGDRVFPHMDRRASHNVRERLMGRFNAPDFTWQALRRTCGSLMCSGGVRSAFLVADRLGHSVKIAEQHYLHAVRGVPARCATVEEAGGWLDLAEQIVARCSR